jgi:hypothetical protein
MSLKRRRRGSRPRVRRVSSVRAFVILALFATAATSMTAMAQGTKAPATKQDAKTATKQDAKTATKAPATKAPAPATKTVAPAGTKAGQGRRPALAVSPEIAPRVRVPVIMREVFEYDQAGRRDPFFSLLTTAELRPTITDLKLVGILYDESGRRPVAIMRDVQNNTQYRVTTGMTLGRMRVSGIRRRAVIFTIEEFGLNRQDTLILGDTSKVRIR